MLLTDYSHQKLPKLEGPYKWQPQIPRGKFTSKPAVILKRSTLNVSRVEKWTR